MNAVAHRDYSSNASVQVMLFSDRLEVWNPGELPAGWTIELLSRPHASVPRNPLIADPMFLAHFAERAGSGILESAPSGAIVLSFVGCGGRSNLGRITSR